MTIKELAAKLFAASIYRRNRKWVQDPVRSQQMVFTGLIDRARNTRFGSEHGFDRIRSEDDFRKRVPIRDYEELRPYVEDIIAGHRDVLWPGRPRYFAKTSGTTSGAKYIPITEESMKEQVRASRDALLTHIFRTGDASFVNGKMIFLQGSPVLEEKGGIKYGRLSGISAHYVPSYLQRNRMPSWETNCIEDWEAKVEALIDETLPEDMRVIAGIPSWLQMYFERLQERQGRKTIKEIFPNLSLLIYGGVNFEPYRARFEELLGGQVNSIEIFPASEGFFAYQDEVQNDGLLLLTRAGIYYEFVPLSEYGRENAPRLGISEVEQGVDYAMIISTNAGLWAYDLGDTVRFVSTRPYKLVVSGRVKHFISAFGEHVIAKEVEQALQEGMSAVPCAVNEFTVAPRVRPEEGELPYHEWFIEFETLPSDPIRFASEVDRSMQVQNSYYRDLIEGKILQPLKVTRVPKGGFERYMKSIGKLGGQNKVKRLSNDRSVAEGLQPFLRTPV